MTAVELLKAGKPAEALQQLQFMVRQHPEDAKARVFLFQLLALMGEWDRATVQLNVAGSIDPANLEMMHAYREVLCCELLREQIFAGETTPVIFGEPADWVAHMAAALRHDAAGAFEEAARVRESALQLAPAIGGMIDGVPFEWIADGDSRLGPLLELLVNGRYYWVPFSRIRSLDIEAPHDLRDTVWMPVHVRWVTEGETMGFVPTRYPGIRAEEDPPVLMARRTEWQERAPGMYFGRGQRHLLTDAGEYPLMDARRIELHHEEQ